MNATKPGDIPWIDAGGERRLLAVHPVTPEKQRMFATFQSAYPLVPRSDWTDVDLSKAFPQVYVKNQGQKGSCTGQQYYATFTYAWLQGGGTYHDFSPCFIYSLINGGRDNGGYTGDTLKAGREYGICLESEVPQGMIFANQIPAQAYETAKRFKNMEAYFAPSFDDIGSAIMLGHPVGFGIEIGTQFNPDSRGVLPNQRGSLGGHDLCAMGLKKISGQWFLRVQNSWGRSWGADGFCYMPESYFPGGGAADNFALIAAREDDLDPLKPPEPKP